MSISYLAFPKILQMKSEGYINRDILERSAWIEKDTILHDETFKIYESDVEEARHLSKLYRLATRMEKRELAVVAAAAMEKHPFMVMQIVAEYVVRIKEGENK